MGGLVGRGGFRGPGLQHLGDQRGGAQRLDQVAREAGGLQAIDAVALLRRQQHHGLAAGGDLQRPTRPGQDGIDQQHGVGRRARQGRGDVDGGEGAAAGGLDLAHGGGADDGVGRGDGDAAAFEGSRPEGGSGDVKGRFEPELGALAQLSTDPDLAAHGLGQGGDDGQPEARAAQLGGVGDVGLDESLEDPLASLGRDAGAGVGDGEADAAAFHGGGCEQHAAGLGELHGVAGEVQQDLAQAAFVGLDGRQRMGHSPGDLDALLVGARAHQFGDLAQQALDIDRRQRQLDRGRAQAGEVQHVIDQRQQVVAALAQGGDIGPLLGRQLGVFQQARHAQHAVQRSAELVAQGSQLLGRDAGPPIVGSGIAHGDEITRAGLTGGQAGPWESSSRPPCVVRR
jgi:hypothetical protein